MMLFAPGRSSKAAALYRRRHELHRQLADELALKWPGSRKSSASNAKRDPAVREPDSGGKQQRKRAASMEFREGKT